MPIIPSVPSFKYISSNMDLLQSPQFSFIYIYIYARQLAPALYNNYLNYGAACWKIPFCISCLRGTIWPFSILTIFGKILEGKINAVFFKNLTLRLFQISYKDLSAVAQLLMCNGYLRDSIKLQIWTVILAPFSIYRRYLAGCDIGLHKLKRLMDFWTESVLSNREM